MVEMKTRLESAPQKSSGRESSKMERESNSEWIGCSSLSSVDNQLCDLGQDAYSVVPTSVFASEILWIWQWCKTQDEGIHCTWYYQEVNFGLQEI